jgi:hypothetical protein
MLLKASILFNIFLLISYLYNKKWYFLAGVCAFLTGSIGLALRLRNTFFEYLLIFYLVVGIGLILYSFYLMVKKIFNFISSELDDDPIFSVIVLKIVEYFRSLATSIIEIINTVENPSIERKENLTGLNSDQTIVEPNSNRTTSVGEAINLQKTTLVKNENDNPNIVSNPITSTTVIQHYMEDSNRLRDGNTNSSESNKPSIDFAVLFQNFMEGLKKKVSTLVDTFSKIYNQFKVKETLIKWKKGIVLLIVTIALFLITILSFGTIRDLYYENKLGNSSEEEGKKAIEYFVSQGTEAYPRMFEILNSNSDPTKSINALYVLEKLDSSVEIPGSVLLNLLKSDQSEIQLAVLKFLSRNPSDQHEIADKILELIQSSKDEIKIDGLIAYSKISTFLTIQKNSNFDYYFQCASDLTSKARSACLKLVNLHPFNIDKAEQLNRLNMDSIGEGDIDTNKEALNYITSQFREKNEFLNWSKKNKIKYFSNIINSAIRKGNKELDKKLLTMVNQNTNIYNDKTIEIFSLLERVNEEDQAKNIIDSITEDNVKNSMLYSFSVKTNRQFSNEYKSVIKNFINSDNKSFINWIKQSGNIPARFDLANTVDLIYDLNENNKEYHDLALYLKKSKAVSSLDQEHLNTLEDIINSYNENQNSSLSTDSMDEDSNYSNSSSVVKVDRSKIEQIPLKKTVTIDFAKFRSGPGKSFRAYDMTLFFKDQGTFRNVDFLPLGRQILITGRSEFQETITGSTDYWYYSSITLDQQEKSESKAGWIFGSLIEK